MTFFKMALPGFETWKGIYDENLSKVWENEHQELRTVSVLFQALQKELKNIKNRVNEEVSQLQKAISQRDQLSEELKTVQLNKSSQSFIFPKTSFASPSSKSPSPKTPVTVSKLRSRNEAANNLTSSRNSPKIPVIFTNLKSRNKNTNDQTKNRNAQSPDLFTNDISNSNMDESNKILLNQTLAQNSPPLNKRRKSVINKMNEKSKESVTKNIFSAPKKSKINNENVPVIVDSDDSFDLDLTYVEGFTQKVDCNADKVEFVEPKIFKESPKMKMKPDPQPEPVIRGKARKFMNATSCKDCEKFYNAMDLPPEKMQQIMKNCSKHRYVYQPREETPPGFWNMSFPDE